jgi:hypothetical protein
MNILTNKWTELVVLTLIVGLSIWTLLMYNSMTVKIADTWTACKTYYTTQCDCSCNGRPISIPRSTGGNFPLTLINFTSNKSGLDGRDW